MNDLISQNNPVAGMILTMTRVRLRSAPRVTAGNFQAVCGGPGHFAVTGPLVCAGRQFRRSGHLRANRFVFHSGGNFSDFSGQAAERFL